MRKSISLLTTSLLTTSLLTTSLFISNISNAGFLSFPATNIRLGHHTKQDYNKKIEYTFDLIESNDPVSKLLDDFNNQSKAELALDAAIAIAALYGGGAVVSNSMRAGKKFFSQLKNKKNIQDDELQKIADEIKSNPKIKQRLLKEMQKDIDKVFNARQDFNKNLEKWNSLSENEKYKAFEGVYEKLEGIVYQAEEHNISERHAKAFSTNLFNIENELRAEKANLKKKLSSAVNTPKTRILNHEKSILLPNGHL